MSAIDRAVEAAARLTTDAIAKVRKRLDDQQQQMKVASPPPNVQSARIKTWDPAEYLSNVDDSKLYRDPSRRTFESLPSEQVLVSTSGNAPMSLRNRGAGPSDRYLTLVADVPEYAQKQGLSGTVTAGGLPQVENKQQLKPLLARGLSYDQGEFERMARSNPVARNAIRATVERVAQASEYYAAPDIDWEAIAYVPGMSLDGIHDRAVQLREATERAAEVLNLEWYHNPDLDPQQIIREQAYAMVPGFVLHEFGIDPRLQGRRKTTFVEHRAQSSVLRWLWDQRERWCGIVQNASGSPGLLADIPVSGVQVQGMPVIDARKLLLVTNQRIGLNLEGLSDLRAAWYASQGKTEWFVSALMHRRKWGNGFPLFKMDADSAKAKGVSDSIAQAAKDFFYSGQAYMGLPPGVTMEMLEFDSDTGFIAAMEYFDKELLRSLGALATEIGQSGGSYNLMDVQQSERLRQLQGYAVQIKSSRKQWIEAACATIIGDLPVLPELRIEGIMTRSDREVLDVWNGVAQVRGILKPDGTPMYTETDIRSLCDVVGVPFTSEEDAKAEQEVSDEEVKAAPLLVGALQVAQQVLGALQASEANPNPIAPEAAILLLSSAGVPEDVARKMVDAQVGKPLAPVQDSQNSAESAGQGVVPVLTDAGKPAPVLSESLTKRRAKTIDDIDTKPSNAMAKTAARALEWRSEFGRGGTEVGVARARDIANRKNLSEQTIKRMASYFARHKVDKDGAGFEAGSDGFPSAGRIAWDLWGGDAGAGWAERKVAEFEAVRERAKRLHAKPEMVIVIGRDGQKFETHRSLMGIESSVAWSRLYNGIQFQAEALTALAQGIATKQRAQFLREAGPLIAAGDVKAIAALKFSMFGDYQSAFLSLLQSWSDANRAEMLAEIRSQVGAGWKPKPEPETFYAELSDIVETQASNLAKVIDEDWQKRVREVSLSEASGLNQVSVVKELPMPTQTWVRQGTQATTQVANLTREEVARVEGPPIESATYSAIMDRLTCRNCKALDGKVFKFGSPEYLKNRPPLYNCLSTLGPYGNVCRCIYAYRFAAETGEGGGAGFEQD